MTRSNSKKTPECHVLNFFYDDEDSCALTVIVHGIRFHIIADVEKLKAKSKDGRSIEQEYRRLLSSVKRETEDEEHSSECAKTPEQDAAAEMHTDADSQDSGHGTSEIDEEEEDDDNKDHEEDRDSAVDVSEQHTVKEIGVRDSGIILGENYSPESEKSLQNWMLSPFGPIFDDLAPESKAPIDRTLHDWYHKEAYFFNLEIQNDTLSAKREESSAELRKRMDELIPSMPLPKYIQDLKIPMIAANNIAVIDEGAEPEPYHPTRVKVDDQVYFLKMVDMSQYQPTKREIELLKECESKDLHRKINLPTIHGLVYDSKKSEIMGFLQTDIHNPTPLTKMLDTDVVEKNRQKWARETQRIIDILHENNIVWGDAKADNFVVDGSGELWVIDFGGSYTEGWVDPELMETREGDDMGVAKIVNALEDPERGTFDPEDGEEEGDEDEESQSTGRTLSRKRTRSESVEEEEGDGSPAKRRRKS